MKNKGAEAERYSAPVCLQLILPQRLSARASSAQTLSGGTELIAGSNIQDRVFLFFYYSEASCTLQDEIFV